MVAVQCGTGNLLLRHVNHTVVTHTAIAHTDATTHTDTIAHAAIANAGAVRLLCLMLGLQVLQQ